MSYDVPCVRYHKPAMGGTCACAPVSVHLYMCGGHGSV